uniref:Uncharacterized protein n=2 Tax=Aegilops tauschii subsp. strangulata TaxID=200361 RepID=A0A453S8L5_AEGTS
RCPGFLGQICDFAVLVWCAVYLWLTSLPLVGCLCGVVSGFAESTLLNQQLADGDDTDEELRRENTTSVNTLSSTASSHLTCCASCTGSTLCYPKI